jgi:hypothetical protein
MKRFILKLTPIVWCSAVVFCISSCKMEEDTKQRYPELPASVAKKLIRADLAKDLSERFVRRITRLQNLEATVHKYSELAEKEQAALQSEALKAIYSNRTNSAFELSASNYYTLKELESYIEYAKREAAKQKINLDGFRIYMGLFPNDPKFEDKQNFLTVFITPTGSSATQEGAFFTNMQEGGSDITTIGSLEYGGNGNPPSASYPQ